MLERDPTRDLAALGPLRAVIHDGKLIWKTDLDREIADQLAARDRGFERNASTILSRAALFRAARRFVG